MPSTAAERSTAPAPRPVWDAPAVRIVVCDEDGLIREAVESLVAKVGHEIVGVADTTADGVALVQAARPDAVIFDMTIGYNTDFDVIEAGQAVGATVIVFAYNTDDAILSSYPIRPIVVHKPDLVLLEASLRPLTVEADRAVERGAATGPPARSGLRSPRACPTQPRCYQAINGP